MSGKVLKTARRRRLALSALAICAVAGLLYFLASDTLFLIIPARLRGPLWGRVVPPLPSSAPRPVVSAARPGTGKEATDPIPRHDPVMSHIKMMYGMIEFVQRHPHFVYSEDGHSFSVEEHVYTSVEVPDSLRGIAGLDEGWTYQQRMRAVHSLPDSLSPVEQNALLHFLHKKLSDHDLPVLELNAVKNDVATHLMRQIPANPEFPLHLIAMYFEHNMLDITWRNYCIQFLGQCYPQIATPEHRHAARETLFAALKDTADIAAPAIIAIDGLAHFPGFSRKRIADEAFKLAADPNAAENIRMPALQIAAKHKHPQALELAKNILADVGQGRPAPAVFSSSGNELPQERRGRDDPGPRNSIMLKMSAIAAIGTHGSQKDIPLLQPFRNSPDIRLRTAARAALKKLQKSELSLHITPSRSAITKWAGVVTPPASFSPAPAVPPPDLRQQIFWTAAVFYRRFFVGQGRPAPAVFASSGNELPQERRGRDDPGPQLQNFRTPELQNFLNRNLS